MCDAQNFASMLERDNYRSAENSSDFITVIVDSFFLTYAPDAPQPVGLLCYPSVLDVPTFAASPSPHPCYPRDP
jgi:hypothetical protein